MQAQLREAIAEFDADGEAAMEIPAGQPLP